MKLQEAREKLGVSDGTFVRYRKTLGIFDETREEITENQYEAMRKLRDRRKMYTRSLRMPPDVGEPQSNVDIGAYLTIDGSESLEVKNLKKQYNNNLYLISYISNLVEDQIVKNEIPEKYLVDSIEKFQKLNMQTLNTIQKIVPGENVNDTLATVINDRINAYT